MKEFTKLALKEKNTIFMYSGQGAQYYRMGQELYKNNKVFYQHMNKCNEVVEPMIGCSLLDILYRDYPHRSAEFDRTLYTHPASFMIGYSLTQVVYKWEIVPDYVLGYSLGEYIALAVAQAIDWEQMLKILVQQAILLEEKTASATMVAVLTTFDRNTFSWGWLASENFSKHFILTIPIEDLPELEQFLRKEKITFQKLPISHGFHSPLIDPIEKAFRESLQKITWKPLQTPIISTLTGAKIEKIDIDYLWNIVRRPIDFRVVMGHLESANGKNLYLDIGPSGTMATFAKYNLSTQSRSIPIFMLNQFGKDINSTKQAQETLKKEY